MFDRVVNTPRPDAPAQISIIGEAVMSYYQLIRK